MAYPYQQGSSNSQQRPYVQRVWGQGMQGMGQPGGFPQMPFVPPNQMQHPFGMPPNQFPGQGASNPQPGPINHPFLNEQGMFDFNKVIGHANNVNKLISTTQPMIKQLSPIFNMFKGR